MRLILLTLFLIAAVDGGIVDKVKGVFSGDGSFGQKLKNATIVGFKKLFENTALFKIRDKIRSMKDKVLKTLELTPKMMKSLEERLKVDWLSQFNKETTKTNDNYNMTYDYGSIMHYGGTSASFNKKANNGSVSISTISKRLGLHSFLSSSFQCLMNTTDAKKIAKKPHRSNAKWVDFLILETAKNASAPPSSGCGDTIKASSDWTRLENTVGLGRDEQEDFETCHYWIEVSFVPSKS
ncbi:astacin [Cooperia oncophora]